MAADSSPQTGGVGRNSDRTRRAVLDATAKLLTERGTAISIKDVAAAAGVSKSGLLHHFGNRDGLFLAVVRDYNQQFRDAVIANLDLAENRPGKMLRAFIRTMCVPQAELAAIFAPLSLMNAISNNHDIAQEMFDDSHWWEQQLTIDGIKPEVAHIIQRAAEGIASATLFGEETPARIESARQYLLAMTENPQNYINTPST